ncbi:ABC1 kinase family protein [Tepidibacter formicigenes]|jgi:ubiquinone biosynthesis protein|uniref:Ubiquinone biosynthesis protein n=1 Tax=Tepidibacter formicigenes DSM 15518 TaxID=1123349 RepID=A0A1M6MVS8_9FIRM|nr:AarF/UbiB family protein [Tepidibacter formicigenes]SHJ87554.1 ubiquinone biosynthesis protein [Tepidibacter formicigenes DSM 15518]
MIKVTYNNLRRYKEIVQILIKYGFSFLVEKLKIDGIAHKIPLTPSKDIQDMSTGERIRRALEDLGPTFIKLGQILSTRNDILEPSIIEELSKLQNNVTPFEFKEAKKIFKEEIGLEFNEIFKELNTVPVAAASIGQVYEGKLKDGKNVIVKIQRPNIENTIKSDLELLYRFAKVIDEYYKDTIVDFSEVVEDFAVSIIRELDYNFEARNCEKFREIFSKDKNVYIPKVHWDFTSKKVLTLEKINGINVSSIDEIKKRNWNPKNIARIGAMAFMKQVFFHGFFHADPHPGNIFATGNNEIAFIDFGIVGLIDNQTLDFITEIFFSSVNKDVDKIINSLIELDAIDKNTNLRKLREEMAFFIHYYYDMPIKRINISELLNEFMRFCRKNKVKLPSQFAPLAKAIITIEGCGKMLDPEFSVSVIVKEFIKEFYLNKFKPENLIFKSKNYLDQVFTDFKVIPRQIKLLLRNFQKNEIKFTIDEIRFTNLEKEISNMTNKLSVSLIISSTIVGSSLIITTTKTGPSFKGYPLLGIVGFIIATIMGMYLIVSILISNRNKR